ncbi:MAG: hypothetical protein QOJ45_1168 [Verrucomicrobiota bacterium]|jgi:hypothetical protein
MTPEGIPPAQIPNEWIQIVVRLLREGPAYRIHYTTQARIDWENTFPAATGYDLYEAMADALEKDGTGKPVYGMREKGDVYKFWFYFDRCRLFGKINLRPSGDRILIYSAHIPRKGDIL